MGDRKAALIVVFFGFFLFFSNLDITYAPSENWVEVARFTGRVSFTTDYFKCEHAEWRIRWSFASGYPYFFEGSYLNVATYKKGNSDNCVDKIDHDSYEVYHGEMTNGAHYIHDNPGKFYMKITSGSTLLWYTIYVEQNTESTQAFSSKEDSANWAEVISFSGDTYEQPSDIEIFTCDYAEWRIKWEYEPNNDPGYSGVPQYKNGMPLSICDENTNLTPYWYFFYDTGVEPQKNGTTYFHDSPGTFQVQIDDDIEDFTIIVEEDLNSIPEFPSWTILPLLLIIMLFLLVVKRKLFTRKSKRA
jgi:hypothetical protein